MERPTERVVARAPSQRAARTDGVDPNAIIRVELIERLRARWRVPITVMRASAGAGKTTAMYQAVADNRRDPRGRDVVFRCRPADADESRLVARLADQVGAAALAERADSVLAIVDHFTARSPEGHCLVFDDAHRIAAGTSGATAIERLVDERPQNLSFVFVTRGSLPIPTARYAARQLLSWIDGDDQLFFSADERAELAEQGLHGVDDYDGWPALVTIAELSEQRVLPADFVAEEVVADLDPRLVDGLRTLASLESASVDSLHELPGFDARTIDRVLGLPLVSVRDGAVSIHDLWRDALGHHDPESGAARAVFDAQLRAGDLEEALTSALELGRSDDVQRVVFAFVQTHAPFLPVDVSERWLRRLDGVADVAVASRLLRAGVGLPDGEIASEELLELAATLQSDGERDAGIAALSLGSFQAYRAGRLDRVLAVRSGLDDVEHELPVFLQAVRSGVDAVLADLQGDAAQAVALLGGVAFDSIPSVLGEQLLRLLATNLVALGRADEAVDVAAERLAASADPYVAATGPVLEWFAGDPRPVAAFGDETSQAVGLQGPELVVNLAFSTHMGLALGRSLDYDNMTRQALDAAQGIPRLVTMAGIARAAAVATLENDDAASSELCELLGRVDLADSTVQLELRRFPSVVLLLAPDAFDDRGPSLGPSHARVAQVVELLGALRSDRSADHLAGAAPTMHEAITALPLRLTCELLCRAHGRELPWAKRLAADVFDLTGVGGRRQVERLAGSDDETLASYARSLLGSVAAPPDRSLRIEVLGPMRLVRDGLPVDESGLRRSRVRQLIALLVARGPVSREQAVDWLWPDASPELGRRNLRTNLSHVRKLLEPRLKRGQPAYYLRDQSGWMLLAGTVLTSDFQAFETALALADECFERGEMRAAEDHYESAAMLWRGAPFPDLEDLAGMQSIRQGLIGDACRAATTSAELALAHGDAGLAGRRADRALEIDAFAEAAHRVRIAALAAQRDVARVRRAVGQITEAADDGLLAVSEPTAIVIRRALDLLDRSTEEW